MSYFMMITGDTREIKKQKNRKQGTAPYFLQEIDKLRIRQYKRVNIPRTFTPRKDGDFLMPTKIIAVDSVEQRIFYIRGQKKVMLDRHLAELYGVET